MNRAVGRTDGPVCFVTGPSRDLYWIASGGELRWNVSRQESFRSSTRPIALTLPGTSISAIISTA